MRRYLQILGMLMCFASPCFAMSKAEQMYRDAFKAENLGLYDKARLGYYQACVETLNKKEIQNTVNLTERMPVLISAAFRLGIVTSKTCFYEVHPLGYQLDMFNDADEMVQQAILLSSNLHDDYPALIPKQTYAPLFFARAYNRIGWSSKLVFAIPWKQYVVHPPTDCILILQSASDDLQAMCTIDGVNQETATSEFWVPRLKKLDKASLEFRAYQLMRIENDPEILASNFAKRYQQFVFPTITYIQSQVVKDAFDEARKNTTYQDILSKKNSPLFEVFSETPKKIGL